MGRHLLLRRKNTVLDLPSLIGLIAIAPLLVWAGMSDLRYLRIPNWISLLMIAGFVGLAFWLPAAEIQSRLIVAALAFVIGFILFALGTLGAGDVKMLSALLLFVPSQYLAGFFLLFSIGLAIAIIGIVSARRFYFFQGRGFLSIDSPNVLPMGISIGFAGIALPVSLLILS